MSEVPANHQTALSTHPPHAEGPMTHSPVQPQPESLSTAKRPGIFSRLLLGAGFLALLAILFFAGFLPLQRRQQALAAEADHFKSELPVVTVTTPIVTDSKRQLELPGDVQAVQQTQLFARTGGYIKKWNVDIGDVVKEGDVLAEIDAPEVDAELAQAKASVEQARARLLSENANLELARTTLERYELTSKTGATSIQDLNERKARVDTSLAAVAAANADIAAGQANADRLFALQNFEKIIAPFGGIVTARNAEVGDLIVAGRAGDSKPLFELTRTDIVRIFVNVPQTSALGVKAGLPVKFALREYPGREFIGQVARTSQAIDPTTRTLRTEVRVSNPDGTLLAGMYVRAKIEVTNDRPTYLLPGSAVVGGAAGNQVALVKDGKIHFQKVELGDDFGNQIAVVNGLSPTDSVVSNPGERIVEGGAVNILKPEVAKK